MNAVRPEPTTLVGRYIQLEPLTPELLPQLHHAIALPQVFASGYGGGPAGLRTDLDEFVAWSLGHYQWDGLPFAVRLRGGEHDGTIVGTSTLGDLNIASESAHIGWTAYNPRVWGTAVNAEAKLLLLGAAFDHGFGRVKIQADSMNARSRAAIGGIGASFEGIIRRDRLRADGTWRDTAIYSILKDEWPRVRALLTARLDRSNGEPVQYREVHPVIELSAAS